MSDDPYTIYKLDEDLEATFEDNILPRLKDGEDVDDVIHDCADSEVPIYYAEQLELAQSYSAFLHEVPNLGDNNDSPMRAIALNIYDYCYQELAKMVQGWEDNKCLECNDTGYVIDTDPPERCTECGWVIEEENDDEKGS